MILNNRKNGRPGTRRSAKSAGPAGLVVLAILQGRSDPLVAAVKQRPEIDVTPNRELLFGRRRVGAVRDVQDVPVLVEVEVETILVVETPGVIGGGHSERQPLDVTLETQSRAEGRRGHVGDAVLDDSLEADTTVQSPVIGELQLGSEIDAQGTGHVTRRLDHHVGTEPPARTAHRERDVSHDRGVHVVGTGDDRSESAAIVDPGLLHVDRRCAAGVDDVGASDHGGLTRDFVRHSRRTISPPASRSLHGSPGCSPGRNRTRDRACEGFRRPSPCARVRPCRSTSRTRTRSRTCRRDRSARSERGCR